MTSHLRRSLFIVYIFFCSAFIGIAPIAIAEERSLGKVNFPVSCDPNVQETLNQGVALLHHMMYIQAEKEFQTITKLDPDCAMAYWGIAMTQFHPLWAPPNAIELQKGQSAIEKAHQLKPSSNREQVYILATKAFYDDWRSKDHEARIAAWQSAQEKVFDANPDDIDAGAFYALSLLATAPKQDKTFTQQKKAGFLLEELYEIAPEHPALYHYTIHAYDNPVLANRAVTVARGYDKLAPDVPHGLHMPSHIFVRMGMWPEVIDWNNRSAAAAKAQSGDVMSLHYIHALDYLNYAYLQVGQYGKARDVIDKVNQIENHQDSFVSAYGIAAVQARYPLERADWQQAATLPVRTHRSFPWDKYPQYEAITYYTRGLGAARSGDVESAQIAKLKLDELYDSTAASGDQYWPIIVDAQRKAVDAWVIFTSGNEEKGLQMMAEAADIEDSVDKHPVTPGSVMPARDLLGDMQIISGNPDEALAAYDRSLKTAPNRAYSLYGAGYAAESAGDHERAMSHYEAFVKLTNNADDNLARVNHAREYIQEYQSGAI